MNEHVKRMLKLADESFGEYRAIHADVVAAKEKKRSIEGQLKKFGKTPVLIGRLAECEEQLKDANARLSHYRNKADITMRKARSIMADFEKSLDLKNTVTSGEVNYATLKLLESGILNVHDYESLFNDAERSGNRTMMRIIGDRALKASKEGLRTDSDRQALQRLNGRAKMANDNSDVRVIFEGAIESFGRRLNTPELIDGNTSWNDIIIPALTSIDSGETGRTGNGGEDNESGNAE